MPEIVTPYLVVDADDKDLQVDTPEHQAFLDWLRSEGVIPEQAKRCEVYAPHGRKPPYAVMTMYEVNDKGVKVFDEVTEECVTYTDIVTLSSLPPETRDQRILRVMGEGWSRGEGLV